MKPKHKTSPQGNGKMREEHRNQGHKTMPYEAKSRVIERDISIGKNPQKKKRKETNHATSKSNNKDHRKFMKAERQKDKKHRPLSKISPEGIPGVKRSSQSRNAEKFTWKKG